MGKDLVVGIDSSTSATKAIAWNREGEAVAEGRLPVPLSNPSPGLFEQDPNDWWGSTAGALKQLSGKIDPARIAAISISNQRETFAAFDHAGEAVHPGLVWLDMRAVDQVQPFAKRLDFDRVREICGKPVDVILPFFRMMWLRENRPEAYRQISHYADVHCYLNYRLVGHWITSIASADPSGMLDMASKQWSEEILDAAKISMSFMPGLAKPGEEVGRLSGEAATAAGLPAGIPVIAGGGDGQCAAFGAGTVEPSIAYMNLGTALVAGVYSSEYGHDQAFRTENAISDGGYIFETVLRTGTFLIDWFARELAGSDQDNKVSILKKLEEEASKSPIGSGGLTILPFWQGSMTPHWDADARGIIAGLSGSTKRGDIYRAILEGLALDQAYALEKAMKVTGGKIDSIVVIGGGSASKLFLQIIADALNVPVLRSEVAEASSLGAAMSAAYGAGWYDSLSAASSAMRQKITARISPDPNRAARYAELRAIYDDLWPTLSAWNRRLRMFAQGGERAGS